MPYDWEGSCGLAERVYDSVTSLGHQTCDYRLWVRVLPQHHCTVALGKLLTPVCLCHQAV